MTFRLTLTEGGQRTPQRGLETLCPSIWLTSTGREPDHIHYCGPVKGTKHYSLIAWSLVWITVFATVIYYPRKRRHRLGSMSLELIPNRVYLAYTIIICEYFNVNV